MRATLFAALATILSSGHAAADERITSPTAPRDDKLLVIPSLDFYSLQTDATYRNQAGLQNSRPFSRQRGLGGGVAVILPSKVGHPVLRQLAFEAEARRPQADDVYGLSEDAIRERVRISSSARLKLHDNVELGATVGVSVPTSDISSATEVGTGGAVALRGTLRRFGLVVAGFAGRSGRKGAQLGWQGGGSFTLGRHRVTAVVSQARVAGFENLVKHKTTGGRFAYEVWIWRGVGAYASVDFRESDRYGIGNSLSVRPQRSGISLGIRYTWELALGSPDAKADTWTDPWKDWE